MKIKQTIVSVLLATSALFAAPSGVIAQTSTPATKLELDVSKTEAVINRNIFGQFAEHLGKGIYGGVWVGEDSKIPNVRGIRKDVVAALKDIKVPVVRWPGGCFADEYHWRTGIGTKDQRRATLNPNWGGVIEPNTFGTHEFFDFIDQIGSEAYISINIGSGTPNEAADWLEYMTSDKPTALAKERAQNGHEKPFKVPYLGLGNEAWGCGGAMTPEHYVEEVKKYARYTRNYGTGQTMQRIAVGPDGAKTEYTEAVMKAWSEKVWSWDIEGLSLHSYTVGGWPPSYKATGFGEKDYAVLLKETLGMDTLIKTTSAIMDKYDKEKKVGLFVDEWGAWLAPTPGSNPGFLEQQNSQRDAVLAALNINIFAKHADRVRMTNIAQMVNVLQAMVFTDNEKMVLTPTYHIYKMYVPFQDAKFIPVSFDAGNYKFGDISMPKIDAIAAQAKDGKYWLAITNIDPNNSAEIVTSPLGLKAKTATGSVLSAPKIDSVNTFENPNVVAPKPIKINAVNGSLKIKVPPASVIVVSVE